MSLAVTVEPIPRAGWLARASHRVLCAEMAAGAGLVAAILALMLGNAVSRTGGRPLVWTDELAVHLMVCLAFLGASMAIAARGHMTMGLLPEILPARARAGLAVAVDVLVMVFLLVMAAVIWRWLDVPGLVRAGSGAALARETFNFAWTDPTLTLGVRKMWFWLVMPLTCATGLLHGVAVLAADWAALRATP